jgi:response regulator RpfG family c-di-GMP phosphodiesterase
VKPWKILIVDDERDVHDVSRLTLKRLIFKERPIVLYSVYSAAEAKDILMVEDDIALLLLDIFMEDDRAGLDLVRFIREEMENTKTQIIIRTGQPGHAPVDEVIFKYEVNDYQEKSELTSYKLKTSVVTALRAYDSLSKIELLYNELEVSQFELFYSLGQIAESRSKETGNHVKRVGEISKVLALKVGKSEKEAELIKHAASMHDIGKMAIPDEIITKPGKLTFDEYEIMKTHATIGYNMLISSEKTILHMAAVIAKEHHENYDGSGYPDGLAKEGISLQSRIVAVADVFDALGNKRVYKEPWDLKNILEYMKDESGRKFDPDLIDILFDNMDVLSQIRSLYPDYSHLEENIPVNVIFS